MPLARALRNFTKIKCKFYLPNITTTSPQISAARLRVVEFAINESKKETKETPYIEKRKNS